MKKQSPPPALRPAFRRGISLPASFSQVTCRQLIDLHRDLQTRGILSNQLFSYMNGQSQVTFTLLNPFDVQKAVKVTLLEQAEKAPGTYTYAVMVSVNGQSEGADHVLRDVKPKKPEKRCVPPEMLIALRDRIAAEETRYMNPDLPCAQVYQLSDHPRWTKPKL